MKNLLWTAFFQKKHYFLMFLTLFSMCFLTFASQLEIFAIGIITNKGPSFFEVFPLGKEGVLTKEALDQDFEAIDRNKKGGIDQEDIKIYLEGKQEGFVQRVITQINKIIPLSSHLKYLALFLVFIALFKAIALFAHRFSTRLVAIQISYDLRQKYFEHIQSLPMSFFQKYDIGTLSSRVVGDAALIAEATNACLVNYLQTPFTVITTLILCFLTSWQLSLMVFLGLPFIVLPITFLSKRVKKIAKQIQENQEKFAGVLIDFLSGVQTVKIFGMEAFSLLKYREYNKKMAKLEKKSARYDLSSRPIVHTVAMLFLATALVLGLYILEMAVSEVLFYGGLLYVFYEPIKKFAEENSHIQRGIAASERMQEVMQLKPDIEDEEGAVALEVFEGPLEFKHLWFRYEENWILKDLSFTIKRGETVAIVGPTGSGKSTLAQLIPRLYEATKGDIFLNGKSIKTFTQHSLREMIAYVPQKPFLFMDTVAKNITYGRPFSKKEMIEAAKAAHADEFICQLPQGYETELAESGKNLSGGQQQRLAIARALIKKAPILIMDEATSSLDNLSEQKIKMAVKELKGQVTQLIIAHRLSTIEGADRILYLEQGRLVAEGSKEFLLKNCPPFLRMWEANGYEEA